MHAFNLMAESSTTSGLVNLVDAVGIIIGLAGALGGAAALFYQNRAKSLIALLQEENLTQAGKITRLEAEAIKTEAEVTALELRIEAYKKLPDYGKVARQITSQHKEVMLLLSNVAKALTIKKP